MAVDLKRLGDLVASLGLDALEGAAGDPEDDVIPTNASSDFLANRAMGDWAESHVQALLNKAGLVAVAYGEDNSMAAGEDGFEEMYLANRRLQREIGKKPDLLIFKPEVAKKLGLGAEIRSLDQAEQDKIVPQAIAGFEVRSSKFRAAKYHEVRAGQLARGEVVKKRFQSYTPKVEDLPLIWKWISKYKVPHAYVQVFFDEVYAIPFERILRVLIARKNTNFRRTKTLPNEVDGFATLDLREVQVLQPKNSNFKKTNMIPVPFGYKLATIPAWTKGKKPEFALHERETDLGRLDAYVQPLGGEFELYGSGLKDLLAALAK